MQYNKGGFVILLASVFFSFLWFIYLVFLSPPMDLGELEADTGGSTTDSAVVQLSPTDKEKPWLVSDALIAYGQKSYQTYCASCHGKTGVGDGLAAKGLTPPPRNIVEGEWKQGGSSIQLYQTLINGIEGTSMVSFSYLSSLDRWALVHYVRSITNNEVKDDPEKLENFAKTAK